MEVTPPRPNPAHFSMEQPQVNITATFAFCHFVSLQRTTMEIRSVLSYVVIGNIVIVFYIYYIFIVI